ncbi:MAG: hypothetical protein AABO41_04785 [Acidobacteriota bacterium]
MSANPTHLAAIDGDATLQVQEDKLNFGQNGFTAEATSYAKAAGGKPPNQFNHTNNVTFTEVDIGADVRPIHLKVVEGTGAANLADDQDEAFDSEVYIEGAVKRVVGYHEK